MRSGTSSRRWTSRSTVALARGARAAAVVAAVVEGAGAAVAEAVGEDVAAAAASAVVVAVAAGATLAAAMAVVGEAGGGDEALTALTRGRCPTARSYRTRACDRAPGNHRVRNITTCDIGGGGSEM